MAFAHAPGSDLTSPHGRRFDYIEGWHAIAEANRIFGFEGWDRITMASNLIWQGKVEGRFACSYAARVRISVRAGDTIVSREGSGCGKGLGAHPAEAHDMALKAAETDATKRALATFGAPFGLSLYLSDRPIQRASKPPAQAEVKEGPKRAVPPNGAGAAPAMSEPSRESAAGEAQAGPDDKAAQPVHPSLAGHIDKSLLAFPEVKRIRDKDHLKFVASQPCLVCGRSPAQAHHLTFAQPRAMSRKVSDEFTVPLCALHHRSLHASGNERSWWQDLHLDPLRAAEQLSRELRRRLAHTGPLAETSQPETADTGV